MSSAINIAWGQRDAHGWTCPRSEGLSVLATPATQSYQLHCQGERHRAGISPVVKGHQLSMTRFFNKSSQGLQPSQLQSQESSRPSEDPSSPRSGASEPLALSLSPTVLPRCMGALPPGVPSPIALRGRYPLMRHSHEKVHWMYVDGVGCFLRDPPCKGVAQVDDNGHLMPCTPCEALPRNPTMCKWMQIDLVMCAQERRSATMCTIHTHTQT